MKIAVLVSGNGSNLQALIDARLSGQIVGVISNKPEAYALERAKNAKIATQVIEHKSYPDRALFDHAIHEQLLAWGADLIVLAGFMRILSERFVQTWQGKLINIHPSLLPFYKGMHTHQRVINTGDRQHGCTVHYVIPELDAGPIVLQGILNVSRQDNAQTLAKRVHQLEHVIYPEAVEQICTGQIRYTPSGVLFKGQPVKQPLIIYQA